MATNWCRGDYVSVALRHQIETGSSPEGVAGPGILLRVTERPRDPFGDVRGSHVVDYVLRNVHQQLVALSSQADLKANIMITVTSILLSLSLTHLDSGRLRWSAITFSGFLLLALVFALLSVLPKFPFRASVAS